MAWAVHREWGPMRDAVERELDGVIRTIAEYEPVRLLTPPDLLPAARARQFGANVEIVPAPVDDIWMRDIAPVFARRGGQTIAIDFNFNGWDNSPGRPGRVGDRLARTHDFGVPVIGMPFVGEGGAFVTNGNGAAVTTRSCLKSRNPHADEATIARAFRMIGITDLIWLDGDGNEPITTGHADGYVAFLPGGAVAVEPGSSCARKRDIETLRQAADEGRIGELVLIPRPRRSRLKHHEDEFAATYANLYPIAGAVLVAKFGDDIRDRDAERWLREVYPGRDIRTLAINAIARGGGGIRCLTQPVA
jgi:agmatine deiminase